MNLKIILLIIGIIGFLTGPQPIPETVLPANFYLGFWHGLIAPVSLVTLYFESLEEFVSYFPLFYQVSNEGVNYDFGFLCGISFFALLIFGPNIKITLFKVGN